MRCNSPLSFVTVLTILLWLLQTVSVSRAFSMSTLYGIPNSGWRSPQWNWGSAVGTGHDCAAICRRQYASRPQRQELIQHLLEPSVIMMNEYLLILKKSSWFWRWHGNAVDGMVAMADDQRDMEKCWKLWHKPNDMKLELIKSVRFDL